MMWRILIVFALTFAWGFASHDAPRIGAERLSDAGPAIGGMARATELGVTAILPRSATVALAAGSDAQFTNRAGTPNQAVIPDNHIFDTPGDEILPTAYITLDLTYKVTATNISGIIANVTRYATIGQAYTDATTRANAPVTINLAAGTYDMYYNGTNNYGVTFTGRGVAIVGHCCGADLDGDGVADPDTHIITRGGAWIFQINSNPRNNPTDKFVFKNLDCGPHDGEARAGAACINFIRGPEVYIINNIIHNFYSLDKTACVFAGTIETWEARRYSAIKIFDTTIENCSIGTTTSHNLYLESATVWFIRSGSFVNGDTSGSWGHALKTDNEKTIVLDSFLENSGWAGSNSLNTIQTSDSRIARNFIRFSSTVAVPPGLVGQNLRADMGGGFSLKQPPIADVENLTGPVAGGTLKPNFFYWADGNTHSTHAVGTMSPAAAHATSVTINYLGDEYASNNGGNAFGSLHTLSTSQSYTVRIYLDTGAIQEFTATPTSASLGTATFPVTGGGSGCIGGGTACLAAAVAGPSGGVWPEPAAVKLASAAWDTPLLNSRFFNKNDPNYFFAKINDGTGKPDLTKQDLFNTAYYEDNMLALDVKHTGAIAFFPMMAAGPWNVFDRGSTGAFRDWHEFPLPPLCRPQGATVAWPNVAGCGTATSPLSASVKPTAGTNPTTFVSPSNRGNADFFIPYVNFFADNGLWHSQNDYSAQLAAAPGTSAFPPAIAGWGGDYVYVDGVGARRVTNARSAPVATTPGSTTLSSGVAQGAQDITVANGAVCSNGKKIQIELPYRRGASRAIHISTVDQTPRGNSVHMADGMVRAAVRGAAVVCFTKSAARPAYWITPDQYATR